MSKQETYPLSCGQCHRDMDLTAAQEDPPQVARWCPFCGGRTLHWRTTGHATIGPPVYQRWPVLPPLFREPPGQPKQPPVTVEQVRAAVAVLTPLDLVRAVERDGGTVGHIRLYVATANPPAVRAWFGTWKSTTYTVVDLLAVKCGRAYTLHWFDHDVTDAINLDPWDVAQQAHKQKGGTSHACDT